MRRLSGLLAAVAVLTAPSALGAQMASPPAKFGIVGAVNLSTLGGSDASNAENKVGFSIGAFMRLPMSGGWTFQPELEYAVKGAKESFEINNTPGTAKVDLTYLEAPLLFRVAAPQTPSGRLYAEFGPALAFRLDCTLSAAQGSASVSDACTDVGTDIKSFDLGGMVGAGYEFPLGSHALSIGARYNYGLIELSNDSNAKNRNLQFVGALTF